MQERIEKAIATEFQECKEDQCSREMFLSVVAERDDFLMEVGRLAMENAELKKQLEQMIIEKALDRKSNN